MTIQKSCDVIRLYISSVTTPNISATPMNYLQMQEKESKFLSYHLPSDAHILGDIELNRDYYYTPHFISKAEDNASPQPDH
jgi:hypothetical protein